MKQQYALEGIMEGHQEHGNPREETECRVCGEPGGLMKTYGGDWDSSSFCGTRNKCKLKHRVSPSMPAWLENLKFG